MKDADSSGAVFALIQSYNRAAVIYVNLVNGAKMSNETENNQNEDAFADALSAVLVVVIPVVTIIFWLSGLPTS